MKDDDTLGDGLDDVLDEEEDGVDKGMDMIELYSVIRNGGKVKHHNVYK